MADHLPAYENWRDFFEKKLTQNGDFVLTSSARAGNLEIYSALKGNPNTRIEVGYFSSVTIIYVHILNPETPGKNRQQEIEHLYKYEFDAEKQYGQPGLEFTDINIRGISNLLDQPFNGHELVYYRNGKAVRSKLTTSYYPDFSQYTIIYNFENESFLKKLYRKLSGQAFKYDEARHIDLKEIFGGLNNNQ